MFRGRGLQDWTGWITGALRNARSVGAVVVLAIALLAATPSAQAQEGTARLSTSPGPTAVIGAPFALPDDVAPVKLFAAWDTCPKVYLPAENTAATREALAAYRKRGIHVLHYHPLGSAEPGQGGWAEISKAYPDLERLALATNLDGKHSRGFGGVPRLSNASDAWLEFMVAVCKQQIDAGFGGMGFDEGWGSLGPGPQADFNPQAMANFRRYLVTRYSPAELVAKGVRSSASFDWGEVLRKRPVYVEREPDRDAFTPGWWRRELGRPLRTKETYTQATFEKAVFWQCPDPLIRLMWTGDTGDYGYFNRLRLRQVFEGLRDEVKPFAAERGQSWLLAANVYNGLRWDNAAVGAAVLDVPLCELSYGEERWPKRQFTAFFKTMAAMGKRACSMFWPGQVLKPQNDADTEALLMFLADTHAAGGITQHPGSAQNALVNPFYTLIQAHNDWYHKPANVAAVYYSLGNFMGDVGRESVHTESFYGAARLLADTQWSYDVLFQGDVATGRGMKPWVNQQVSVEQLSRYALVVVPNVEYMQVAETKRLLAYVRQGGVVVVGGRCGERDFANTPLLDPTWRKLADGSGAKRLGRGWVVRMGASMADDPLAAYDGDHSAEIRARFVAQLKLVKPDITTRLGPNVHVHRYVNAQGSDVLHLVNLDYDLDSDKVCKTQPAKLAFVPRRVYANPQARLFTPSMPNGSSLPLRQEGGRVVLALPSWHVYGVVVVSEAIRAH